MAVRLAGIAVVVILVVILGGKERSGRRQLGDRRRAEGIPIEPGLAAEMRSWSDRLGVASPL